MRIGLMAVAVLLAGLMGDVLVAGGADSGSELTERFGGRWVGSYSGDDSGKVTIVLTPGTEGAHKGTLSASSASGDYEATFKVLTLEGTHMSAKYDVASGEGAIEGEFDGELASGTWSYHDASGTTSGGTWKVTRQAHDQTQ